MVKEKRGKELPEGKPKGRSKHFSSTRRQRNISHNHTRKPGIQLEDANFTKTLQTLKPHDHLCLIYESPEEWRAAAVPFIAVGLKHGEKCLYIADTSTADEIRKYLAEEGIDVASAEKSGQLAILHHAEAYTREDSFDPDSMIALLAEETEKAIAEGYPVLRVTGEMTWVLHGHPGSGKLLEYEAKLNRDFFPYHPCLAICQYDRWKFDSEVIKGVIMTHPLLVRGNRIYHNFYYIPPEEFLDRKHAELEAQHWLNNLEREQQIQDTLRQAEEKLRVTIESIPQGVTVSDLNGKILQVNNAVLQLHGYSRQELIGRNAFTLIAEEDRAQAMDNLKKTFETGRSGTLEYTFTRRDGSTFPAQLSAALIKDGSGKPIGFVAVTEDISDRKKMQEQLILTERLASIGQLAAGMAHELNNPLTGIIGLSDMLLEKDLPKNTKEDVVTINKEARRTANVVQGLLAFTREQGTEKVLVDINNIIRQVLRLRSYEQRAKNIEVDALLDPALPQVMGNGTQLQQVFINIVINAEQAMVGAHGMGKLTIATERVGDKVRASITDDGPGISPDNMKKLFTPFFTTKGVGKGTGLGLSICHGIVTEHGGKLYAESELAKVTAFVVELPIGK